LLPARKTFAQPLAKRAEIRLILSLAREVWRIRIHPSRRSRARPKAAFPAARQDG
jgi:hypothetical protein